MQIQKEKRTMNKPTCASKYNNKLQIRYILCQCHIMYFNGRSFLRVLFRLCSGFVVWGDQSTVLCF